MALVAPHALLCRIFPSICDGKTPEELDPSDYPTGEDRDSLFIFSPFNISYDPTIEFLLMALVAVKLTKTDKGLSVLRDIGVQYLKTLGNVLTELESSSSSNWVTAWINQKLSMRVLRRLGLVTNEDFAHLDSSYNLMFTQLYAKEGIVDTFTALGTFFKGASGLASVLTPASAAVTP